MKVLVIGGQKGWIGQKMMELLPSKGIEAKAATTRMENRETLSKEIDDYQPDSVIVAAGLTGRPNVDWCEDHRVEVLRANVIGTLNVFDLCNIKGIHCTYFGTGCIYTYDDKHTPDNPVTEEDPPNFQGSYYSKTKGMIDQLSRDYDNVLNLRLRMPISDDLSQRSIITKLLKYNKLIDIPNSMSVLSDLLPISVQLLEEKATGTFNFTNPGVISHNEILRLYKQHVDPDFHWENFTLEEQNKVLKAGRSNTALSVEKLQQRVKTDIPHIKDSVANVLKKIGESRNGSA